MGRLKRLRDAIPTIGRRIGCRAYRLCTRSQRFIARKSPWLRLRKYSLCRISSLKKRSHTRKPLSTQRRRGCKKGETTSKCQRTASFADIDQREFRFEYLFYSQRPYTRK